MKKYLNEYKLLITFSSILVNVRLFWNSDLFGSNEMFSVVVLLLLLGLTFGPIAEMQKLLKSVNTNMFHKNFKTDYEYKFEIAELNIKFSNYVVLPSLSFLLTVIQLLLIDKEKAEFYDYLGLIITGIIVPISTTEENILGLIKEFHKSRKLYTKAS